ncbi:CoA-transferase family III [Acidocella aminolytica 101 = DSM 11237]|nr:CoA transferase [Acidocella aminolytica]SHF10203.1 CoA-transferase family III [Acidocella aminolytica 101 = DSM 11237]
MSDTLPSPLGRMLVDALHAVTLPPSAAERLHVTGGESLHSCFAVTDLAVAAIATAGLALSELLGLDGAATPVTVDRHLASAWFQWSLSPEGWKLPVPWDPIAGDYETADGWIRLHTNAPHHRAVALAVLGCAGDRDSVTEAVARRGTDELEAAVIGAGGCAATMRSLDAWRVHEQGRAVAAEPLIATAQTQPGMRRRWRLHPSRPLSGIKVLDLTRVLAGPISTRFLAGLGAEVLRIDPPSWDEPGVVPEVTLGKRCARLNLHQTADRCVFEDFLEEADILVHGYRPGALEGLGYGEAQRRAISPGLIDVSLCAYGWTGPWAGRRGFDSLVQMSSGIADEGMRWRQAERPVPLPAQALDHATGYLMAAAAIRGLIARVRDEAAFTARLSLARTAALLVNGGEPQAEAAFSTLRDEDYTPETEHTAWGPARRLRSPILIGGSPLHWDLPASPLGSAKAAWGAMTG